jgi:hypothetical protein
VISDSIFMSQSMTQHSINSRVIYLRSFTSFRMTEDACFALVSKAAPIVSQYTSPVMSDCFGATRAMANTGDTSDDHDGRDRRTRAARSCYPLGP